MNKMELAEAIAEQTGVNKGEAEKFVGAFVDVVTDRVKNGEEVSISGFGSFSVSERAARAGVNPQNPTEKIQIPATRVPKFRAGKSLKDAVRSMMRQQ